MQLTACEHDIIEYINNYSVTDYETILAKDNRWEVFYNFSEMRKSILNWYDFNPNATVLEIGGEFGALTGLFCEKCSYVTTYEENQEKCNAIKKRYEGVDILEVTNNLDYAFSKKYNYIVLIGGLERLVSGKGKKDEYVNFLRRINEALCDDGVLLLAVENRYGVKYFCGYRERYTGIPFAGINGYDCDSKGYTFSRAEIEKTINQADIGKCKFFYPLPDYKLTQVVYSDDNLPKNSIRDKVISYYVDKSTLISCEDNLYDDIIENNVLPFMANSFLVEVSKNGKLSDVSYAALSTDRIKREAFATIIYGKNAVRKKALFEEGSITLNSLCNNIEDISNHGIAVVPHTRDNDRQVSMPFVASKTLMYYLQEIIHEDKEQVYNLLDLLYESILASSEHVAPGDNELLKYCTEDIEFGIILHHAYIDMIPYNCFIEEGKLRFYDQEFKRDNYPAGYIMFRTLWYMSNFISDMEKYITLDELKDRYNLSGAWKIYQQAENEFIEENRNHTIMKSFYSWIGVDKRAFYQNND